MQSVRNSAIAGTVALSLLISQVDGAGQTKSARAEGPKVYELSREGDSTTFAVDVNDTSTGQNRRLTFSNATREVLGAVHFRAADRVAVLGKTSAAQMITILDAKRAKVVDSFYGLNASISPTGRWILYEHFRGGGAPESGVVYAVYDVALPPEANRRQGASKSDVEDAGRPIYPERQHRLVNWDGDAPEEVHICMSRIAWIGDNIGAVVDRSSYDARLLVMTLGSSLADVEVKAVPLDLKMIVDYSRLDVGQNAAKFLLTETIVRDKDDPDSVVVNFKPMPELRVLSTRVKVW